MIPEQSLHYIWLLYSEFEPLSPGILQHDEISLFHLKTLPFGTLDFLYHVLFL